MSQPSDETLKLPDNDPAAEARARIAALTDSHLEADHPLLKKEIASSHAPRNDGVGAARNDGNGETRGAEEPKPATHDLGRSTPLHSQANLRGMPAEVVSNKRKARKLPSRTRPIISAIASFLLLMLIFKSEVIISQVKYWTSDTQVAADIEPKKVQAVPTKPLLEIPKLRVKAPMVFEQSIAEPAVQKALKNGVVHYGSTPRPGQPGNTVILGHSSNDWWDNGAFKFVFVNLDKIEVGDKFAVNYKGTRYIYQVYSKKVVVPTDLSVLAQTTKPTVTLITCTPPGTNWRRLIVKGEQISPKPQSTTAPPKQIEPGSLKLPSNAPDFVAQIMDFVKGLFDRVEKALS